MTWRESGIPHICIDDEGVEHFDVDEIIALLLRNGTLMASGNKTWCDIRKEVEPETVTLFVNCSDVFAWACADAEPLPYDEIGSLYKHTLGHEAWGADKWCCKRRQQKPQKPVEKRMREEGAWDDEMEALPENTMDAETQAIFAAVALRDKQSA